MIQFLIGMGAAVGTGIMWALPKILAALGVGVLTYSSVQFAYGELEDYVLASYTGLPSDILQIFGLYGVHQALGIILGAITVKVSLIVIGKIGRIT